MGEPTILDSVGNRLQVGDRVRTTRGLGHDGTVLDGWHLSHGLAVQHDGDRTWSFYKNGDDLTLIPTQEDDRK